jgi:hypothetical protein
MTPRTAVSDRSGRPGHRPGEALRAEPVHPREPHLGVREGGHMLTSEPSSTRAYCRCPCCSRPFFPRSQLRGTVSSGSSARCWSPGQQVRDRYREMPRRRHSFDLQGNRHSVPGRSAGRSPYNPILILTVIGELLLSFSQWACDSASSRSWAPHCSGWRSRSSSAPSKPTALSSSPGDNMSHGNEQNGSEIKGRRRVATGANHPASLSSAFRRGPGTPAAVP